MQIIANPDQTLWNEFIRNNSSPSAFLQTWEWGEFQQTLGNKVHRLAVQEKEEYLASAQAVVRPINLGKTYLEVAKGPVATSSNDKIQISNLIEKLQEIAKKESAILVRINPPYEGKFQVSSFKFQKPKILMRQMEPEDTVLVDLSKSEEELLSNMHEKSRYNIRLAQRKGVKVHNKTADADAFEKFLELIEETAKRDRIVVWPRERFQKFREQFMTPSLTLPTRGREIKNNSSPLMGEDKGGGEVPRAILLTGEYEGQTLAAAIVMLFGDAGTYLYAASSAEHRNANVPSLVLWEAIRQTKLAGKKYYDMWGIAPGDSRENHSWAGITRFKTRYVKIGETGLEKHYPGTHDLILDKKYHALFRFGKAFRKLIPK